MTFYTGWKDTVNFQMYAGRTVGLSFPMDGNKHNDSWRTEVVPAMINGKKTEIVINTYEDGSLISIEVGLPGDVIYLTVSDR